MSDRIPSCFRAIADPPTANSNLTTSLYHTSLGLAILTWSRTFYHTLTIDLHLDQNLNDNNNNHTQSPNCNIASFRLQLNPWFFWKKKGSKKLHLNSNNNRTPTRKIEFHWDLSRAKFLSGPEPLAGFFIAITFNREMLLLIGDCTADAYARTKTRKPAMNSSLLVRREHVFGNKSYATKAVIGGKSRDILIECGGGSSSRSELRLSISIEGKRLLQVKRLKWKFRGNERFYFDGILVHLWWDVYNWLFDDAVDGHAVFMFRFEEKEIKSREDDYTVKGLRIWQAFGLGLDILEKEKMRIKRKKSLLKTLSSSSSSSSVASSGYSSSVMEWASTEESEMQIAGGFSLLVYAWRT